MITLFIVVVLSYFIGQKLKYWYLSVTGKSLLVDAEWKLSLIDAVIGAVLFILAFRYILKRRK